jgi:DNA-binding IclR family transcriptional regulator
VILTDYTIAVLEDALQLLELLSDNPEGLSLAQITETSGLIKNKVFRILHTLEKHQMVERSEEGCYTLGRRLTAFGQSVQNKTLLLDASRPVMDWLVVETSETIFLGVAAGSDALCIAARESPHSVRLFAQVGRRAPLLSGGVPKILFAFLPEAERNALLDRFSTTATERNRLDATLAQIRQQGYVIVVDELDIGAHSIAAPIRNHEDQVIAGISIAGPSNRFDPATITRYVSLVCKAASQISQRLGYEPTPLTREVAIPDLF